VKENVVQVLINNAHVCKCAVMIIKVSFS